MKQPHQNPQKKESIYDRVKPIIRGKKIGRNDLCPCYSGKKYKKCCGNPVTYSENKKQEVSHGTKNS